MPTTITTATAPATANGTKASALSSAKLSTTIATAAAASTNGTKASALNSAKLSTATNGSTKPFTVCVFCGASPGKSPVFIRAAEELARVLHKEHWSMVYGGGTVGMMGAVSSALVSLSGPSSVHGIIPSALIRFEGGGLLPDVEEYGRTTVVADMHTRKSMMGKESDAFIALPGGFGTLEELFEVVTWNQLGIHSCPIVLLNIDGFYDGIMKWIENAVENGFIKASLKNVVVEAKTPEDAAEKIKGYKVAEGRFDLNWESEGVDGAVNGK